MVLSKSAALVLSLIAEGPVGAYDMVGTLAKVNARRWFPISDSSVYITARTLAKRGLAAGRDVREGNMPAKTVYTITEKGEGELLKTLNHFLRSADAANPELDVATLFLCRLKKAEVLGSLEEKETRLTEEIARAEAQHRALEKDDRIPFTARVMVKHAVYLKEAELKTIRELSEGVRAAESWDFFVTKDLR